MVQSNDKPVEPGDAVPTIQPADLLADRVATLLRSRRANLGRCLDELVGSSSEISRLAAQVVSALRSGRKILVAGNGGSAAEAQHFAAELVGRFQHERSPYPAIALTTDTSILTAIGNDYGFAEVFARQVRGLGAPGDVFIALSTSGTSENLVQAVRTARVSDVYTVAITGEAHSPMSEIADHSIRVPIEGAAAIQEVQGILLHLLCEIVEADLAADERMAADD